MSKVLNLFPEAVRPGEYMAFFSIPMQTKEGKVYLFIAIDAFSEFAFNTGAERNENPESVLRCLQRLMVNKDFLRHRDKGFTLVLEKYDDLSDQINTLIHPFHGQLMINMSFLQQISKTFMAGFQQFLSNPMG